MGYTMIQAKSVSYGGTRSLLGVRYIVIHYTGNNNDTAKANCNFFRYTNTRSAGAHFFVDQSGTVYQSIPLNRIAWSVGGFFTQKNGAGSLYKTATNTNSVSIELCDIASKDPSSAMISAVRTLVKYIQGQCPNAKTIIRHWDVNGKSCPARMTGTNNSRWTSFKSAITSGSSGSSSSASTPSTKPASTPAPAVKPAASSNIISVDGEWGKGTTKAAQKVFGTTQDGIVSRQIAKYRSYMPNCLASSWDFRTSGYSGGSALIKAIQKWCGVSADGLCGPGTIKALQKKLGVGADGYMGPNTVKAFQKYLNRYL